MSPFPAICALALLFGSAPQPVASIKPHPSVYRMANEAAWIVEGKLLPDGGVEVVTRHFAAAAVGAEERVEVRGLATMSRTPFDFGKANAPITPDRVLLFLVPAAAGGFEPLHLLEGAARGVLWFCGDDVYGYHQFINPGPYELGRWNDVEDGKVVGRATPDGIRAELRAGLAARERWQATLAIADPVQRAIAVVRWFSPATSPDARRWFERAWPDLREQAKVLGAPIVMPLARLVATDADGDAVGFALSVLGDLGEHARPAVPMVVARLRQPGAARPFDLVRALSAFGDERAIAVLRDGMVTENDQLAAETGRALHRCGDLEAAVRIVRRLPAQVDGDHPAAGVIELLDALHDVAPERAVALYRERFAGEPEFKTARRWLREL
ncbi:MAG: hypothetical protein U1E73_10520 [Planctomycetota bacterium]